MMIPKRRITKAYFMRAKEQYRRMMLKASGIIGINVAHAEELMSYAEEEFLKCMICYDGRGSFSTLFYHRLFGTLRHMRDAENRARRMPTITVDSMYSAAGPSCDMDVSMTIDEYLACLDENERLVVTAIFFQNKTVREISADCGIVPSTICRIKHKAMDKMRQKCLAELE